MDSIDFVSYYHEYLKEISQVTRPEFDTIIDELGELDPHDLVKIDAYFMDEKHLKGIVWNLFLKLAQNKNLIES